jgi:hypothetical protein
MTATLIKKNRANWMAVQELPEEQWLNSGVLNDTSRLLNYSRWSITPVLSETHLTMIESIYSTNAQASAIEWEQILDSKMLCHEVNHFYTRQGALTDDFRTAMERCIQEFIDLIFPNWQRCQTDSLNDQGTSAPPTQLPKDPKTDIPSPMVGEDEDGDTPSTNWDGLLSAELILRSNNDHKLTDLTLPSGRDRMANFIRSVNFLDAHDAHSIAQALDNYVDGALPRVPKMSLVEMSAACKTANVPLVIDGKPEAEAPTSGNAVHYDRTSNRYSIQGTERDTQPTLKLAGDNLKAIF